jgi:hypothetical protein
MYDLLINLILMFGAAFLINFFGFKKYYKRKKLKEDNDLYNDIKKGNGQGVAEKWKKKKHY